MVQSKNKKPFLLGLCGPTGSGKSTLSQLLAHAPGWHLVPEPRPTELLAAVSSGVKHAGYALQEYFISNSVETALANWKSDVLILDRTLVECSAVFLPLHRKLGNIDREEYKRLQEVVELNEHKLGQLDAVVVLSAAPEILLSRMRADRLHLRPSWLMESLGAQLEFYGNLMTKLRCPHIRIDTSESQLADLQLLATWCIRYIRQPLSAFDFPSLRWGKAKLLDMGP